MMDPGYICKEIHQILHEKDLTTVTLTQPLSERYASTPQYVLAKQATLRKMVDGKNLVRHIAKFSFENCNYVEECKERDAENAEHVLYQTTPFGVTPAVLGSRSPSKVIGEVDANGRTPSIASVTIDLASLAQTMPELAIIQGRLTFYSLQFNITQMLSTNPHLPDSVVHEVQASSTYSSTNNVFQALLGFSTSSTGSVSAASTAAPRLRVVLTPSTGRATVDPDWATNLASEDSMQQSLAYLQVHSKDALYPPENGVDTLHIVVVRPEEAEVYVKNYCPRGYVVAVLPEQEEDSSVGCVRFWCCAIARLLKAHWAFILDDNLSVHEQVRASNAPSNPKHVPGGPKKYALQLMTGIKVLEDVVGTLRAANSAKVGLLSLRRAGANKGNGRAVSLSVCTGVVYVNIDALFAKALYFRKEMHVYEALYLSQLCLLNKLATLQLSYVEYSCVRSVFDRVGSTASSVVPNALEYGEDTHWHSAPLYEEDDEEKENNDDHDDALAFQCDAAIESKMEALTVRESGAAVQALLEDEA